MQHILIDTENINPIIPTPEWKSDLIIYLFEGPTSNIKKYKKTLKDYKIIHIKLDYMGKDALDNLIMFELGRLIEKNPTHEYIIYSNDKGFSALVKHLKSKFFKVAHKDVTGKDIPYYTPELEPIIKRVISHLNKDKEYTKEHMYRIIHYSILKKGKENRKIAHKVYNKLKKEYKII